MAPPEHLIAALLASSREHAVICIDGQGRIQAWLGAAEQLFGYTAEEAVGQPAGLIFTPEDREQHVDAFELFVASRSMRADDERWHLRKDGARIWASGSVECLRDPAGQVLGYVKIVRDRTDLKTRIDRLEEEAAQLPALRARHRDFLSTLGHELRNSLAPIANAGHILARTCTDARSPRALEILGRQVDVLRKLAEDLLDVARAGTGAIRLELRTMDLRELLQITTESLRQQAQARRIGLECLLPHDALWVQLDPERFERVVLNLLGNALKYTPPGGHIWLTAAGQGSQAILHVQDTGIGISAETLPRIFELFTQEARATEMAPAGLGVGLAIVKQLVDLHGGSIEARSAGRDKGSEFTVRLPRVQTALP